MPSLRVQFLPPSHVICGTATVPLGKVMVGITPEGEVCRVSYLYHHDAAEIAHRWQLEWPATQFTRGRIPKTFTSMPMLEVGTDIQQRIWQEITTIPKGQTATYGEIADRIDLTGRARAVGRACKLSNLAYLVPCHRIISASGIGGFGTDGIAAKAALLRAEGVNV